MTSAGRIFRLTVLVGMTGFAALVVVVVALVGSVSAPSSLAAVATVCRQALFADISIEAIAIVTLASLGIIVLVRAAASVLHQLRAMRRFLRALGPTSQSRVGGRDVSLLERPEPDAFCAGLLRPRIYLSRGAVDGLAEDELTAVVAHEAHHKCRRDPLRILLVRTMADALFFAPVLKRLSDRYGALAELAADEAAVREVGGRRALASALLSFGERGAPDVVVGIAPERVEHLLGERPRWHVPMTLFAASVLATLGLIALALLTLAAAGDTPLKLSALIAQTCMVAMLIGPAAITLGAVRLWRSSPIGRLS